MDTHNNNKGILNIRYGFFVIILTLGLVFVSLQGLNANEIPSNGITKDLSASDAGDWISTSLIYSLDYDNNDNLIYLGIGGGKFGAYDYTTNVTTDLSATDTGDWISTSNVAVVEACNDLIYLGASGGLFGVYNSTSGVTTDLSATDTGDWISTNGVKSLACDNVNNLLYVGAYGGKFGVYNVTTNVLTDLSATDTGDWIGTNSVGALAYDANHNLVYLTIGGSGGKFGVYNDISGVTTDLGATDTGDWISTSLLYSLAYDTNNDLLYIGLGSGKFGVYDFSTGVTTDLSATDTGNWFGAYSIYSMDYDTANDLLYMSLHNGEYGYYNMTANVATDLSDTDVGNWIGTSYIYSLTYDSTINRVYLGLQGGLFGVIGDFGPIVPTITSIGGDNAVPYMTSDNTPTILSTTDMNGDCRASIDGDESYADMVDDVDCTGDGTTSHICEFTSVIGDGATTFYVACKDEYGNENTASENVEASATITTAPQSLSGKLQWQIRLYINDTAYVNSTIGYLGYGDILDITYGSTICSSASLYDENTSVINTTKRYDYENIMSWTDINLPINSISYDLDVFLEGRGIWYEIAVLYYNGMTQDIRRDYTVHPPYWSPVEPDSYGDSGGWTDLANTRDGDDTTYGYCSFGICYSYANYTVPNDVGGPYGFSVEANLYDFNCISQASYTCTTQAKIDGVLQMRLMSDNTVGDYASSIMCWNGTTWRYACSTSGTDAEDMRIYSMDLSWNITEPTQESYNITLDNTWFDVESVTVNAFSLTGDNVSIGNVKLYQSGDLGFCAAEQPHYLISSATQPIVYVVNQTIDLPLWNVTTTEDNTSIYLKVNESYSCIGMYAFYSGNYLYNKSTMFQGNSFPIGTYPTQIYPDLDVSGNPFQLWNYISLMGCSPGDDYDWYHTFVPVVTSGW